MSKQDLNAFRKKMNEDEGLRREMSAALGSADVKSEASVNELVDFAKARGFDFTAADLRDAVELSDEQLEAVAGGAGYLKIGDIKGESSDDGHKDWINLLSVSV